MMLIIIVYILMDALIRIYYSDDYDDYGGDNGDHDACFFIMNVMLIGILVFVLRISMIMIHYVYD